MVYDALYTFQETIEFLGLPKEEFLYHLIRTQNLIPYRWNGDDIHYTNLFNPESLHFKFADLVVFKIKQDILTNNLL